MIRLEDKEAGYKKGELVRLVDLADMNHVSTMLYQYEEKIYGTHELGSHPAVIYSNTSAEPLLYLGYHCPFSDRVNHFFLYQQKIWYSPMDLTRKDEPKSLAGWFCSARKKHEQ